MHPIRPSTLRGVALLTAASAASAAGPASAAAQKKEPEPTRGVELRASLKYLDGSKRDQPAWRDIKITLLRDGKAAATDQPLPAEASISYRTAPRVLAIDLDDNADPEAIVDIGTTGERPGRKSVILYYKGSRYLPRIVDWGTGGYRLDDVTKNDGPEFVSSDSRLPQAYGSTARGPLRVLSWRSGKLRDVSRQAKRELKRDASRHRRALARARRTNIDTRPEVAAYAVDLVRLGQVGKAQSTIREAGRRKELRGSTRTFARRLDGTMRKLGYSKRRVLARGL